MCKNPTVIVPKKIAIRPSYSTQTTLLFRNGDTAVTDAASDSGRADVLDILVVIAL